MIIWDDLHTYSIQNYRQLNKNNNDEGQNGNYKKKGWGMSLNIIYSICITANQDDSQRATVKSNNTYIFLDLLCHCGA